MSPLSLNIFPIFTVDFANVLLAVLSGSADAIGSFCGYLVAFTVGFGVTVGVLVDFDVTSAVGVISGTIADVGVGVGVGVGVEVGFRIGVGVGVGVDVGVDVTSGVVSIPSEDTVPASSNFPNADDIDICITGHTTKNSLETLNPLYSLPPYT